MMISEKFYLQGSPSYNAFEKDIALVNIYFGDSTVFGEPSNPYICKKIIVLFSFLPRV